MAAAIDNYAQPNIAERERRRKLSANEKAMQAFFERNLPPGWKFTAAEKTLTLTREAPVYLFNIPSDELRILSKPALLTLAKQKGKKTACSMQFKIERHDDIAIVRQRVRLYKEIRADIDKAYNRLNLKHLCRGWTPVECSLTQGQGRKPALEFLATRNILIQKLELTPVYRLGTLYLYPQRNQCVLPQHDWYISNMLFTDTTRLLPLEAGEEIEIILRNMQQLTLWE
ncbi:MAG: hypothetical protein KF713_13865 [Turneriella sp.]|nr:hypothetical protein [Turneriella sp.]